MVDEPFDVTDNGITVTGTVDVYRDPKGHRRKRITLR